MKHLPDFALYADDSVWKGLEKKFANELEVWNSSQEYHLMTILTFGLKASGVPAVEEISLMLTNKNWIPFETGSEREVLEELEGLSYRFTKGLRFNLNANKPIASFILLDGKPKPVGLFIVPSDASEKYEDEITQIIADRPDLDAWIWRQADGPMPQLPRL